MQYWRRMFILTAGFLGFFLAMPTLADRPECHAEAATVHCGEAPSAHVASDGRLWVVFAWQGHAWVTWSDDLGKQYSEPVRVNPEPENIEVSGENRPKILLDEPHNTLYISWTEKTEGMHTGNIRFTRSTDGGQTFEAVRTINDDGLLTSHRFESMLLAESGDLFITWLDKRELEYAAQRGEPYTGSGVFYTVSNDQGRSFASNRKIADHSCECCRIAVAPHGSDGVALMWRHVFGDTTRDHAIAVIDSEGVVHEHNRATVDDWQINACPHHGPDMTPASGALSDDAYHLTWFSAGNINRGIYYGRHSLSAGETTLVKQVDGRPGASHPQIVDRQGHLSLVWKRFDGTNTQLVLLESHDAGASWSDEKILATTSDASDHPLLIEGPEGVYVSWLTREKGYQFMPLPRSTDQPVMAGGAGEADIQPFLADTFAALKAEREGEAFLLALWSVDCPPCMAELNMLGELLEEYPDLPLILVSTDQIDQREDAEDFLFEYGLEEITSWMFADPFAERLRFTIDPQWFGELPRSYYFDARHQPEAHSGILTERQARDWLGL